VVFSDEVENALCEVCEEISKRYDMKFLEIGVADEHVHFLIQSIPRISPSQIIKTVKSITAREIFKKCPEVKKELWGGELWSDGYFVSTVGKHGNEKQIEEYVKKQGKGLQKLHEVQLRFW
jgi:REP element-mobilizing transposase RayT